MQGIVVHYDTLTRCGIVYDETGQSHYFRQEHLTNTGVVTAGQRVNVRHLPDNTLTIAQVAPAMAPAAPLLQRSRDDRTASIPFFNWPGVFLAVLALGLLLAVGGKLAPDGGRTPRLIGSAFGIATAMLLAWLANLLRVGIRRGRARGLFWSVLTGTFLAYASQSCSYDFQVDQAFEWYGYTLIVLFFALYLLPYHQAVDSPK